MKETPILFSGPMIRAILSGTKTQTRRVIKGATGGHWNHGSACPPEQRAYKLEPCEDGSWMFFVRETGEDAVGSPVVRCPYGQPGDRLWVRETWSQDATSMYPCPPAWYRASDDLSGGAQHTCPAGKQGRWADCLACWEERHGPFRWRPSIFMPRWASRITLEIVSARVERVQEISEEDAKAEGVESFEVHDDPAHPGDTGVYWKNYLPNNRKLGRAADSFQSLWDSINAKRGFGWDVNPWVWVISFRRIQQP